MVCFETRNSVKAVVYGDGGVTTHLQKLDHEVSDASFILYNQYRSQRRQGFLRLPHWW